MKVITRIENLVDEVYTHLPRILQNLLISIQGLRYKKQRFGKHYSTELSFLRNTRSSNKEQLEKIQSERLKKFLDHIRSSVPYYISHNDSNTLKKLEDFPIISKTIYRDNINQFQSQIHQNEKNLTWVSTSGTSGSPMKIAFTQKDNQTRFAAISRQLDEMGVKFGDPVARFSGRTIIRDSNNIRSVSRSNWFNNEVIYSTYYLTEKYVDLYLKELLIQKPHWATGYPSAFEALATLVDKEELRKIGIKSIMVTAETLSSIQKEFIENSFGAKVFNQYGSSEGAPIITHCSNGKLHCNLETGIFEFLPIKDSQKFKRLVVTSFSTHAFPLIRYDIEDIVELSEETKCECGYQGTIIKRIHGRLDDFISSPERGYVGRLDPVFKSCPSTIHETQIVQTTTDTLEVRYVKKNDEFKISDLDQIRKELELRVGNMIIKFIPYEEIERYANGKFKSVVGLNTYLKNSRRKK